MAVVASELQLTSAKYNEDEFTNETHLSNAFLTKSEFLSPITTFMYGGGSKEFSTYNFPLMFMTEGARNTKSVKIGTADLSYKMSILGSPKKTTVIASSPYSAGDKPGVGRTPFTVYTKDKHMQMNQSAHTPSGKEIRFLEHPTRVGNTWKAQAELVTDNDAAYLPLTDLAAGVQWGAGVIKVGKSHSKGTQTRSYTPYQAQNQISVVRQSFPIAGNMANKIMVLSFKVDGQPFKLWHQWELFLTRKNFMAVQEEDLFHSKYNKGADGVIKNTDGHSGEIAPSGAGLLQQITNSLTYSKLTGRYLRTMINDLFFHANGTDKVHLVFFTGTGGMDEVSEALKDDVLSTFSIYRPDDVMKKESNGYYSTGGPYYNKLIHREGHSVTFLYHPQMDRGAVAMASPRHPITGWPLEGYNFYAVDFSTVDGEPNVQYVSEEGRESVEKVVQGMAKTPVGFSDSMFAASDNDSSSVEWMKTQSVALRRPTNCAKIYCDVS